MSFTGATEENTTPLPRFPGSIQNSITAQQGLGARYATKPLASRAMVSR